MNISKFDNLRFDLSEPAVIAEVTSEFFYEKPENLFRDNNLARIIPKIRQEIKLPEIYETSPHVSLADILDILLADYSTLQLDAELGNPPSVEDRTECTAFLLSFLGYYYRPDDTRREKIFAELFYEITIKDYFYFLSLVEQDNRNLKIGDILIGFYKDAYCFLNISGKMKDDDKITVGDTLIIINMILAAYPYMTYFTSENYDEYMLLYKDAIRAFQQVIIFWYDSCFTSNSSSIGPKNFKTIYNGGMVE